MEPTARSMWLWIFTEPLSFLRSSIIKNTSVRICNCQKFKRVQYLLHHEVFAETEVPQNMKRETALLSPENSFGLDHSIFASPRESLMYFGNVSIHVGVGVLDDCLFYGLLFFTKHGKQTS